MVFDKIVLILLVFLAATTENVALAEKYALVIGGPSLASGALGGGHSTQDFARPVIESAAGLQLNGYQTTVLFGFTGSQVSPDPKALGAAREMSLYAKDYQAVKDTKNSIPFELNSATQGNITTQLEDLVNKAKPGDKVEIVVQAHGKNSCTLDSVFVKEGAAQQEHKNCSHVFMIATADGKTENLDSRILIEAIKKLEAKGALPNLVLGSCYSGAIAPYLKDLKNSCVTMLASDSAVGYACFDDDFTTEGSSKDFTSTGEAIIARYINGHEAELEAKVPYLKNNPCVKAIQKHKQDQKINSSSIAAAYWSARKSDESLDQPSISSIIELPYFSNDVYNKAFMLRGPGDFLSCKKFIDTLGPFVEKIQGMSKPLALASFHTLLQSVSQYNESIAEQARLIALMAEQPNDKGLIEKIVQAQSQTHNLASAVIKNERALVDLLKISIPTNPSVEQACQRSL